MNAAGRVFVAMQVKIMTDHLKARAVRAMRDLLEDQPRANYTQLAEHAAHTLDHDEWLDDDLHWIWEVAADIGYGD